MSDRFAGFPPETFLFLRGLRDNNNRDWFEAHKPDYQTQLLQPLQLLVAALGPCMLSIDPDLEVTPAVNRTISRIYRDTRFSRNKSPYKTSNWITFKRPRKEWQGFPAWFFEISPESYCYGMGFYSADRDTMERLRRSMDARPDRFLESAAGHAERFTIGGETYKRPLKPGIPPELEPWYQRKNLYLISEHRVDGDRIAADLLARLQRDFQAIAPLYRLLCAVAA